MNRHLIFASAIVLGGLAGALGMFGTYHLSYRYMAGHFAGQGGAAATPREEPCFDRLTQLSTYPASDEAACTHPRHRSYEFTEKTGRTLFHCRCRSLVEIEYYEESYRRDAPPLQPPPPQVTP